LRQRCTIFAERCGIEKSATLQQHCTTILQQRCTTFDSVIRCRNQHDETPLGSWFVDPELKPRSCVMYLMDAPASHALPSLLFDF